MFFEGIASRVFVKRCGIEKGVTFVVSQMMHFLCGNVLRMEIFATLCHKKLVVGQCRRISTLPRKAQKTALACEAKRFFDEIMIQYKLTSSSAFYRAI